MFLQDAKQNLATVSLGAVIRYVLTEHSEHKFFADATKNTYVRADVSMFLIACMCVWIMSLCVGVCVCVHVCMYYCIPHQFEFLQS